jgi:hypothetical protein
MFALRGIILLLLLVAVAGWVRADGLFYNLPKDGTWATYQIDGSGKNVGEFGFDLIMKGTLRIASVGRVTEDDQPCRWIEVQFDVETKIGHEKHKKSDWWKLLIPEKHLVKGHSLLDHTRRAWYRSEADNASRKMDDPSDGRTSLPIILAGPLEDSKRLGTAKVESKLGKLRCDGMQGMLELKSTRGGALPEVRQKWKLENRVHPDSPFGVVTSSWSLDSSSETLVWHLKLLDFGKDATSKMPEAK